MRDAVEMAVLSTVQHPNIVTVYSCLTDMIEAPGACSAPHSGGTGPVALREPPARAGGACLSSD